MNVEIKTLLLTTCDDKSIAMSIFSDEIELFIYPDKALNASSGFILAPFLLTIERVFIHAVVIAACIFAITTHNLFYEYEKFD